MTVSAGDFPKWSDPNMKQSPQFLNSQLNEAAFINQTGHNVRYSADAKTITSPVFLLILASLYWILSLHDLNNTTS